MPGSFETVHDPVKQQKRRTRAFEEEMRKRREQEKEDMMASLEPPEKEEVTPEPPGPRDTWPCAFIDSGQCEDVCGNQHVLKYRQAPGVAEIGRPPAGAVVKVAYSAHTAGSDVRQWDASESLGFRLGQLWVNRLLDAAAASLEWGERATFVCTRAYAELNNASRHPLPTPAEEHACFRYEVELLSWKPPQLRDTTSAYDTTAEQRIDEVGRLKGAAAPLVQHGYVASARELYADAIGYLENREGRTDGACFVAPEGREVEAHALLASLYLNDAMCTLKLNDDLPRAEALATRALELPAGSLTNAMEVKARFRRGVARTRMHDYAEASGARLRGSILRRRWLLTDSSHPAPPLATRPCVPLNPGGRRTCAIPPAAAQPICTRRPSSTPSRVTCARRWRSSPRRARRPRSATRPSQAGASAVRRGRSHALRRAAV